MRSTCLPEASFSPSLGFINSETDAHRRTRCKRSRRRPCVCEPQKPRATLEASESGPIRLAEGVKQAPAFPEGGFPAWATVAGAALVQFCGIGYTSSFGVYQDFYTREYLTQSSSSAISWIGSINALLLISGGLFVGRLYDRGHFYFLLYGGSILLSFSLFMLSLCKPEKYYQVFLAQGIGAGLGAGALYVPSVAVIAHYFKKRRTLALTIVASGSSLGATIHPIMLNNTLRSHLGFGNAVRASAGLISGLLLVACCLMRPRLPPSQTHPPFWKSLRRFIRDIPYLLATIALTLFTIGYFFPFFYLQLDAINHGLNETFAFYSLVILNASSCVGRLAPGAFASRFGVIEMVVFASGGGAALILAMIALKTVASVVVIGILYGFFAGVFVTLQAPVMAVLTEDMGELGLRIGVAFAVVGLGGLIGPPINGALLTSDYIWWRPALFSGVMAFTGFSFFVATLVAVRHRDARKRKNAVGVIALEKH
ncbi:major facilitator superfamily domain-containing protein [Mycena maculata]|uniref:Major facilitator superfamily domain-containing protein n=1 Tax=Mycena maculata TaxID=230809 RepID=A0AAD7NCF8_9AGAR|nr:major facilitator superfamily domain-containing protein [Mycena maculata]